MNLILKLTNGENITDADLEQELHDVCDRVHSSCDSDCPVYHLNGNEAPDTAKDFDVNRGCDCFKNGKKMLEFIRSKNG